MNDIDVMNQTQEKIFEIQNWKGCEKEYWKAVEILTKANKLNELELRKVNKGLTCYTEDIVNLRMRELKSELEQQIPEVIVETPIETPIEISLENEPKKRRNTRKDSDLVAE